MEYPNMEMRAETADHIIEAVTGPWLSVFPKPEMAIVDNGKSSTSDNAFLRGSNIAARYPPSLLSSSKGEALVRRHRHHHGDQAHSNRPQGNSTGGMT